jgi:hypothetical protein
VPISLARYEARFDQEATEPPRDQAWFAVEADGELLGQGGLYEIDHFNRRCELGIALGRANWGKGFGQDAVVLVCSPMGGTTVIRWLGDSRFLRSSEAAYPAGMHSHAQPADPTTSIRDQLNSWDFIGVFDAEKNSDEYDCLVEPLLSMLKCGKGECPAEWWALGMTGAAAEM